MKYIIKLWRWLFPLKQKVKVFIKTSINTCTIMKIGK